MTDEEIIEIRDEHLPSQGDSFDCIAFARAIEAAARADEREKWNLLAGIKEAIAAGKAEQHAECVRLLRDSCYATGDDVGIGYADWLESHKPS